MTLTLRVMGLVAACVAIGVSAGDAAMAQDLNSGWTTQARRAATAAGPTSVERSRNDGGSVRIEKGGHSFQAVADPDTEAWPYSEVQIARARCQHLLRSIAAEVEPMEPVKEGPCGDPAPVRLKSLGAKPKVKLEPAAVVNCDMVVALHDWLVKDLQPLARRHLKSPIVEIETMSSYSCRNAYGRRDTRLSQHARANAMDIRGFKTAKQVKMRLISHWGPTVRDIRLAELARERKDRELTRASEVAEAARSRAEGAEPATDPGPALAAAGNAGDDIAIGLADASVIRPSLLDGVASLVRDRMSVSVGEDSANIRFSLPSPNRLGGPPVGSLAKATRELGGDADEKAPAWPVMLVSDKVDMSRTKTGHARFLREAHDRACRLFGTVLGPEANQAHRNHFHVDLADRDLGAYCK